MAEEKRRRNFTNEFIIAYDNLRVCSSVSERQRSREQEAGRGDTYTT